MQRNIILLVIIFFAVYALSSMAVFAQVEIGPHTGSSESYLDDYDLTYLMDVEDVYPDHDIVSYLDEIEVEMNTFDEEFISRGVIKGYYTSLDDCISTAVERHLPLQIAKDKIDLSKRKLIKSVRELFPTFSVYYEHNKGYKLSKSDPNPDPAIDDNQQFRSERVRYSLQQPLFRGGALWNQVRAERANLRVTKEEYKKVYYDVTVEVARAYFSLIRAHTLVATTQRLKALIEDLVSISEEKKQAGLISEIEHLNVQSQGSQVEHDMQAMQEDVELTTVEFKKVLHLDLEQFVTVPRFDDTFVEKIEEEVAAEKHPVRSEDAEQQTLDELLKRAYQNRPEFTIHKYKLEAATWQEKIANAGWMPQVSLVAERGRKAEAYRIIDNNPPWDDEHHVGIEVKWNFGGSTQQYVYDKNRQGAGVEATDINIAMDGYYDRKNTGTTSVLDGLEQYEKTQDAVIARKEALLELELAEKDIVSEVKEAYYAYNRSIVQLRSLFKRIVYREKLVDLARHRSEINEIQLSEYIQAEVDYTNERRSLYQALVDFLLAKVALNKAIGVRDYIHVFSEEL